MALTAIRVEKIKRAGRYGDGAGLWLQVTAHGTRSWLLRFMLNGKARAMGLGAYPLIGLAEARGKVRGWRKMLADGVDPIEEKRRQELAERKKAHPMPFREVADLYIAAHEPAWRNDKHRWQWRSDKHRWQWRNTLDRFVLPVMGALPVAEIGTAEVMKALEPTWLQKPETASRTRGSIEVVLDYAKARGWRSGDNLPAGGGICEPAAGTEQGAAGAAPCGVAVARDRRLHGRAAQARRVAARALEFAIVTAARSGEVRGMRWNEISLGAAVWTVPGERMKAGREHRVPLSARAIEVLDEMKVLRRKDDDLVFPGNRIRPLSDMALAMLLRRTGRDEVTAHGFRSSFRDWCAEATAFPREVSEAALAHALADRVEVVYQRGDMLARRAHLMAAWASFCAVPLAHAEVVPLKSAG